jgi:hypothetical protein
MRTFKQHDCEPGQITKLEVEIRSSITHTVTPKKVREWLNGGARTPKDAVMKAPARPALTNPVLTTPCPAITLSAESYR